MGADWWKGEKIKLRLSTEKIKKILNFHFNIE